MSGWLHCPVCNRPSEDQETFATAEGDGIAPTSVAAVDGASPSTLAEIVNQEGATAYEREQFEDAEQLFRRAVELDPDEPLYLTNLAAALSENGNEEEAEHMLGVALEVGPDDPTTLLAAGIFAADRDRRNEAIRHWRHLIEVAPDSEEAEEARSNLNEMGR